MALSDRELRLLAEMEQALSADDPALVSTLSGARRRGPAAPAHRAGRHCFAAHGWQTSGATCADAPAHSGRPAGCAA